MTKKFFMAALAATAMLASCTKEVSNPKDEIDEGAAKVTLTFEQPTNSRAFDADEVDADNTINDMLVFVFRSNGILDVQPYSATTAQIAASLIEFNATNKAASIYIVTNTGAYTTGAFNGVANLTDLKAVTMKIDGNPNATSNVKAGNVWMAGQTYAGDIVTGTQDAVTGHAQLSATVKLNYIAAKVFVVVQNRMTGTLDNTKLTGVAMINAGSYTGFVNTAATAADAPNYTIARTATNMPVQYYYNGVTIAKTPYLDVPAQFGSADDFVTKAAWSNQIGAPYTADPAHTTLATLTDADAFYAFPVELGSTTKTWATIYGEYNPTAFVDPTKTEPAYWSVAWNGTDNVIKENVMSGKKYIATITLKGNKNSGGGKTDDPTEEVVTADLDVTIEQAEWTVVTGEKIYE